MRSNVCKIDNSTKDLSAVLKESEKVAVYNELTHKQTLQLRLLCEEVNGMLPNIISEFKGNLWIEFENGVCKIYVSVNIPEINADTKAELIGISKDKKNVAIFGLVGKIRNAIENFFLNEDAALAFAAASEGCYLSAENCESIDYTYLWTLEQYRNFAKKEEKAELWDELEKSVIASVADDIIVGVKGHQADIIIVKNFA